jgi:hypothetical protein
MNSRSEPLLMASVSGDIDEFDDLEVCLDSTGTPFFRLLPEERGVIIGGHRGTLDVRIYDMQYAPAAIATGASGDLIAALPPSIVLEGEGGDLVNGGTYNEKPELPPNAGGRTLAGVYLIRATVVFDDASIEPRTMEAALIQNIGV